jgi:uncharacterized membrane protein YhaH (DUF805 family)
MKLCGKCIRKPWPYAITAFISGFIAFVTWLTLTAAGLHPEARQGWTVAAFLVAVSLLFVYMRACMRRHCREDGHRHA